ncbi:glycoside hydrolase family 28 protein [Bacteroidota bacterium]
MDVINNLRYFIFCTLIVSGCMPERPDQFDITRYGASIQSQNNAPAIQAAIDACHQSGGGIVNIPTGQFITGVIVLKSNVNLYLSPGAVLFGSTNLEDYLLNGIRNGMIYAQNAKNISITGEGTIHGNGTYFHDEKKVHSSGNLDKQHTRQKDNFLPEGQIFKDGPIGYESRPGMLAVFLSCEQIKIQNVTFKDSPEWTIRFGECDDVYVDGISIYNNLLVPNSDGIHCTASRNIRISNCDIRAGDDAIIVTGFGNDIGVHGGSEDRDDKLGEDRVGNNTGFAENVVVSNCLLQSRSAGIRVGYGDHPIRNCTFQNLVIYNSNRGLGIFARDGISIENIKFSNIVIQNRLHTGWWGNGEPIHVSAISQNDTIPAGNISNVTFNDISIDTEGGIVIYAHEKGLVQDIRFDNVNMKVRQSELNETFGGNFDFRPALSDEYGVFEHEIPGVFASRITDLTIHDFKLEWMDIMEDFHTHGLHIVGSENVVLEGFSGRQANDNLDHAAICLENVKNYILRQCTASPGTQIFLKHNGLEGEGVVTDNLFSNARIAYYPDKPK